MRKAHAAFRLPTQEMVQQHLRIINTKIPNVIALMLTDHVNAEVWKDILVIYNGNRRPVTVQIPQDEWTLVCHDGQINQNGLAVINYTLFNVAPSSASILVTK